MQVSVRKRGSERGDITLIPIRKWVNPTIREHSRPCWTSCTQLIYNLRDQLKTMFESVDLVQDHEASCKSCQIRKACKICVDSETHEACQIYKIQLDQCILGLFQGPNCSKTPPPSQQSRDTLTAHCSTLQRAVHPFLSTINSFPSLYLKDKRVNPRTLLYFLDRAAVSSSSLFSWKAQ